MDVVENPKPLTLDAQYIVQGNITTIRMRFLDLARYQYAFMCQVKPHPNRMLQEDEFNHLLLIDHIWGGCGEIEFINLNGIQTGVRFYLPGPVDLSEIDVNENAIRKDFSRPRIGLWLWENLGWTPKVIELFAEELYEHRVTSLQHIQGLAVDKLGLGTYPLSYFQISPAPQTGKSQTQPDSPLPQAGISLPQWDIPQRPIGISQIQPNDPNPPFGISQIQPGNSGRPDWTSQLQHDDPQPQPMISQNLPDMGRLSERLGSSSKVGLDTALFIYHFEKHPIYSPLTHELLSDIEKGVLKGITSTITLMEIIVKPLSLGRNDIARKYEALLMNFPNLDVVDLDRIVIRQAARLREDYHLRPLDALQVSACLLGGAEVFIANDRQIERLSDKLEVVILDDLPDQERKISFNP